MKSLVYALRTQATMRAAANARQPRPAPWPRPRYPTAEELHYYRLLKYWVELVQYIVKRDIVPKLADIMATAAVGRSQPPPVPQPIVRADAASGDIDGAFAQAEAEAHKVLPDEKIERGAQETALRVSEWNAGELNKQVQRVAKVNIYDDSTGLGEHLDLFVSDNVKLIKSVAFGQLNDLKGVVTRGARAGLHHTEVAKQIAQQFGVTKRRAAVIARDQIGKLNGELNQIRQTNLGVKRYRWSTSQDERVRASHRTLNGTIQLWTKPPVVDPRTGERGHPGQPIQCRCAAIAIIDDVLAEAGLLDPLDVELTQPTPGEQPPLRPVRPPPAPMPPKPPPIPPPVAPPPPAPLVPPSAPLPAGPSDASLTAGANRQAQTQARAARARAAREARKLANQEAALAEAMAAAELAAAAEAEAAQAIAVAAEEVAAESFRRTARAKPTPQRKPAFQRKRPKRPRKRPRKAR